jgi:hypothetical protein
MRPSSATASVQARVQVKRGEADPEQPAAASIARPRAGEQQKDQWQHERQVHRAVHHLVEQPETGGVDVEDAQHQAQHGADDGGDAVR